MEKNVSSQCLCILSEFAFKTRDIGNIQQRKSIIRNDVCGFFSLSEMYQGQK